MLSFDLSYIWRGGFLDLLYIYIIATHIFGKFMGRLIRGSIGTHYAYFAHFQSRNNPPGL